MYNRILGIFATFMACVTLNSAVMAQCTTSANRDKSKYCKGETVTLFAGSGGIIYSWAGPPGSGFGAATANPSIVNAQPNQSGTYTVTVTFQNGCTASATTGIVVNQTPAANVGGVGVFCEGSLVALEGNPGSPVNTDTYLWAGQNGFSFFGRNPSIPNITPLYDGQYTVTVTSAAGCTAIGVGTITINQKPFVSIAQTGSSCAGETLILTASALGASSFSWTGVNSFFTGTPDATLTSVNANSNGLYFVSVTDGNGCVGTSSTLVSVTTIVPSASTSGAVCAGGTVTLTASGGANYVWSAPLASGATTSISNATIANSGTYTVTVSNTTGCSAFTTVNVVVNPNPTLLANATNASCFNSNNGSVQAIASVGTPAYSYNWSNGTRGLGIDNIGALSIGDYSVTVSDVNGCTATASANISQPPALILEVDQIQDATCANSNDGVARANVSGGTPGYTYSWSNGDNRPKVTNISCGQGNVIVTDANGCTIQQNFNIQCPALLQLSSSNANDVKCNGGADGTATIEMVGGTLPYTYDWTGFPANNSSILPSVPVGTYSVNVVDANNCIAGPFTVTVAEPAAPMTITMAATDAICKDGATGTVTATAVGGTSPYNYLWSPPATGTTTATAVDLPASAVPYSVTITDSRGCNIIGQATVNEPTYVVVTASATNTTCYGDDNGSINIDNASGGNGGTFTYSLDNANYQNPEIISGLPASNYTVYAADQRGCTGSTTVTITQPDPIQLSITTGINGTVTLEMGNSVQLVTNTNVLNPGSLNYIWTSAPNISCLNCPSPIVNPLAPQRYTVNVTDADGCTAGTSVNVEVLKNRNIFIPNVFTPNNDSNNDEFLIYGGLGVTNVKSLKIFDRWGELVFEDKNFLPNDRNHSWDGRFQGEIMRPNVFIYMIEIEFVDGLTIPYKGDVTLIR
jgi:gliding motility-associated-like protein